MQYRLDLVLKPAEGALVRVIGMVERRGFAPCSVHALPDPADGGRWHVQMVVHGSRPPETLRLQLQKIYDCDAVDVHAISEGAAA